MTGANATNPCGIVREDVAAWRCHEDGIYVDSVILFNKTTFEIIRSRALQGNDVSSDSCNLWTGVDDDARVSCPKIDTLGPDNAVTAQATYTRNNEDFVAVLTKSGMFYSFRLPSVTAALAKKMGPGGPYGGGLYSLAIDHDNYIAIITITGLGIYYIL